MFTLRIGTTYGEETTWGGNINSTGLLFLSIEDVEVVIALAHPSVWIISEVSDDGSDKEIKVHPLIEETRKKEDEERNRYIEISNKLVDKINEQPTEVTFNFGMSLKLVIFRDKATFDPQMSRRVLTQINCKLYHDNKEVVSYFYPGEYISKDGKVLGKKLRNWTTWHQGLNIIDSEALVDKIQIVQDVIKDLQRGVYDPRDFSTLLNKEKVA